MQSTKLQLSLEKHLLTLHVFYDLTGSRGAGSSGDEASQGGG